MHDDTQPTRVFEMARALGDGQFPVRWVSDLGYGYGYPIFNFYAPLPYYIGAIGVLSGLDAIVVTKLMFGLGVLLAAIFMYVLGYKLGGVWGGIISALVYLYAPYHGVQIYVRGAVGEYWAYAFLPLILYGIIGDKENRDQSWLIAALGLAGVILSHNITAFLTLGFLGLFLASELLKSLVNRSDFSKAALILKVIVVGALFTAWFWLPAVTEVYLTKVETLVQGANDFHRHFVFLDQLWNSPWGYGGSAPGRLDGMSFMLGKIPLVLAILGLAGLTWNKIKSKGLIYLCLGGLIISVFMMLDISKSIWEVIPGIDFVQYPWRFLVFAVFFIAVMSSYVDFSLTRFVSSRNSRSLLLLGFSLVIVVVHSRYFRPQFVANKTSADYISDTAVKWSISRISDEYLPKNFPVPKTDKEIALGKFNTTGDIIIDQSEIRSHFWHIDVMSLTAGDIVLSLSFFPGWKFYIDNRVVEPIIQDGLVKLQLVPGKHTITAYFSNTWPRIVGNWVSLLALFWFMTKLGPLKYKNQPYQNEKN